MLLSKSQERRIKEVIRAVHEKRLAESLAEVEQALADWREGRLPVLRVDDVIHQHAMRAKRYYAHYANTSARAPEAVGILEEAVTLGIISSEEQQRLLAVKR
jgi:hypothetical protein